MKETKLSEVQKLLEHHNHEQEELGTQCDHYQNMINQYTDELSQKDQEIQKQM